jgi:hypothetical protein
MEKGMVIKMKCPKCDGLMIYEKFFDMEESSRFFSMAGGVSVVVI